MAEIRINTDAVEDLFEGIGFLVAAALSGFETGSRAFGIMQEERAIKDLHENDAPEEPEAVKTEIYDCRKCLCDQCAKIEECEKHRGGALPDGIRPYPCLGCRDGMRFKPCEEPPCEEFVQSEGVNNG